VKASLEITIVAPGYKRREPMPSAKMAAFGLRAYACVEVMPGGQRRPLVARHDGHAESRSGVRVYYILESGRLYAVQEPYHAGACRRYFCTATDEGEVRPVSAQEAATWHAAAFV